MFSPSGTQATDQRTDANNEIVYNNNNTHTVSESDHVVVNGVTPFVVSEEESGGGVMRLSLTVPCNR